MDYYFYVLFTLMYVILLLTGLIKQRELRLTSFLYVVIVGLIIDNAVIALGNYIGEGNLLEQLHMGRYWIHAIITPTLILFCLGLLQRVGSKKWSSNIAWCIAILLTCILILIEVIAVVLHIELKPLAEYGILHYVPVREPGGAAVMIIAISSILLLTGFLLYRIAKWKWMLLGTLIMAIGSVIPFNIESTAFINGMELLLMISLVATDVKIR
ncbi:hypothetical protein SH601_12780 [Gracilibacillus sp. S3-1-1]|uniref:Uncharacterized protein n=1 Tax=Gracilibacillus pellucidus TaxID=3095368 RepID=A0ACC6M799_9BACI|nr:hypothetical protein [Gracilibacillus sp. S3-1-1]MDX8046860.1 hypothetical protein [Gracilibacillus sp. S3-1-1]